jgi:hypothetical protein
MTNEFNFHYQGFRSLYKATLADGLYKVYCEGEYVAAFPKDEMKNMIDNKRAHIVEEEDETA